MADLPAVRTRGLCINNPFLIFSMEVGFVDRIAIPVSDFNINITARVSFLMARNVDCKVSACLRSSTMSAVNPVRGAGSQLTIRDRQRRISSRAHCPSIIRGKFLLLNLDLWVIAREKDGSTEFSTGQTWTHGPGFSVVFSIRY
ncbi:conserved hypothetical protein [Histoplasma mississippiense (nom. inval.)]|uniref:conserved hypothetical protein n=1 Tax=Ajellomyces capsulatus (strain NAm1 / WU24) TaxID=2059318 RepID=UPI000157BDB7|nr:conserved hypothetical protein [Histoplasma mississippiense (nom. inval.)]EDN06186.1 conserved hypothetical protein [Histoplasma mississippiense (nom. inval.)]